MHTKFAFTFLYDITDSSSYIPFFDKTFFALCHDKWPFLFKLQLLNNSHAAVKEVKKI